MNPSIQSNLDLFRKDGKFSVLAFDHRGSFVKMMQKHSDKTIETPDAIALKEKIISAAAPHVSGLLIDEDYGLPADRDLNIVLPYLLPAEKTGYTDTEGERITVIDRSATQLKAQGAHGVKLLLYVHHLAPSWKTQMDTAKKVIADAHEQGLPVFLEFVLYSLKGLAETTVVACVEKAIAESVKPDVWKLPYPGGVEDSKKVTLLVGTTPWTVLTGGGSFDEFRANYTIAVSAGAAGFIAGRSVWQEACSLFIDDWSLDHFLKTTLVNRFELLRKI